MGISVISGEGRVGTRLGFQELVWGGVRLLLVGCIVFVGSIESSASDGTFCRFDFGLRELGVV